MSATPDAKRPVEPLATRISKEPLGRNVRLAASAALYATADEARADAGPPAKRGKNDDDVACEVVAMHGDVLEVRQHPPRRDGDAAVLGKWEVTLFARRVDVVPVLRRSKLVTHPDGTALRFNAGMPLLIEDGPLPLDTGVRPLNAHVRDLPHGLADKDVSLSFEPAVEPPLALDGMRAGCFEAGGPAIWETIVVNTTPPPAPDAVLPCHMRRELHGQPPPKLNGAAWPPFLEARIDAIVRTERGWRARVTLGDDVDAVVEMATSNARGPQEGFGIGLGGLRPGPKVVKIVEGDVPVMFADGRPAGSHRGGRTLLREFEEREGVVCFRVRARMPELCHAGKDLKSDVR